MRHYPKGKNVQAPFYAIYNSQHAEHVGVEGSTGCLHIQNWLWPFCCCCKWIYQAELNHMQLLNADRHGTPFSIRAASSLANDVGASDSFSSVADYPPSRLRSLCANDVIRKPPFFSQVSSGWKAMYPCSEGFPDIT